MLCLSRLRALGQGVLGVFASIFTNVETPDLHRPTIMLTFASDNLNNQNTC